MRQDQESKRLFFAIVEDDPVDSAYLMDALAVAVPDARVAAFSNLDAALPSFAMAWGASERSDACGILLLDANLLAKGGSVSDAILRLQMIAPIAVVALVNSGDVDAKRHALAAGADEVLERPADPLLLAQLARHVQEFVQAA